MTADYRRLCKETVAFPSGRAFDVVLEREIDEGLSWQLPVVMLTHLWSAGGTAAARVDDADAAVFVTGAVPDGRSIARHDYALAEKWRLWRRTVPADMPVLCLVPPSPDRPSFVAGLRRLPSPTLRVEEIDDVGTALAHFENWLAGPWVGAPPAGDDTEIVGKPAGSLRRMAVPPVTASILAITIAALTVMIVETSHRAPPASTDSGAVSPAEGRRGSAALIPGPEPSIVVATAIAAPTGTSCAVFDPATGSGRRVPLAVTADGSIVLAPAIDACGVELTILESRRWSFEPGQDLRRSADVFRPDPRSLLLVPHRGMALTGLRISVVDADGSPGRTLRLCPP